MSLGICALVSRTDAVIHGAVQLLKVLVWAVLLCVFFLCQAAFWGVGEEQAFFNRKNYSQSGVVSEWVLGGYMNELAPRDFMAQDIFQTQESVYKSFAPSLAVSNRGMMQLLFFYSFCRLIAAQPNQWEALLPGGSIPSTQYLHAAVWSDVADGFYIFEGSTIGAFLNNVYLYYHKANQWEALSPNGSIPSGRHLHTVVWSDVADGFYLFGGNHLNDLYLYHRWANEWEALSPSGSIPSGRGGHTAVWSDVADGFYIFGGSTFGTSFSDLYLYSRKANSWEALSPRGIIPGVRYGHTAVWSVMADGFYIFGGYGGGNYLNDLYLYSREANKWEELLPGGSIPSGREHHAAVWSVMADGFYIFGGRDNNSNILNDLYLYSREATRWETLLPEGSIPSARYGHTTLWSDVADGFYMFGGQDVVGNRLNDLYLYHPQTTTTTTLTRTTVTSTSATSSTVTTTSRTSTTRTEKRVDRSDNRIFMHVGLWTVAATVFYIILFGVPLAIYAHLMEPGMDREWSVLELSASIIKHRCVSLFHLSFSSCFPQN